MARDVKIKSKYGGDTLADAKRKLLKNPGYQLDWKIYDLTVEIGRIATQIRKRADLTQEQVAERMGVSQPVIARLESDQPERMPTLATLVRFATACGYQVEMAFRPRRDNQDNGDNGPLILTTQDYL